MGWSAWNYVDTNKATGIYRLWYRTHDNYSTDTVALQYEVEVEDSGDLKERWNCVVEVSVDGVPHTKAWSNYSDKNTYSGAGSTVPGHSGYITGYTCIGTQTLTKGVDATTKSRSWTLSLAGGFTAISLRNCTCSVEPSASYYYTNGTKPSLTITDNGNNTATMSGYLGSNGSNNGLISSPLYWTTNGMQPSGGSWYTPDENMGATSGGYYSKTINIPDGCSGIWAVIYCNFKYNRTNTPHTYGGVRYYKAPGNPGKPTISYTKSRLTIKEPWTFSWSAASAGNSNTPVAGYRIRVYKNGVGIRIKDSSGKIISTTNGSGDYPYDMHNTSCSFKLDPVSNGFKAGDTIRVSLYAFAFRGDRASLWSGSGANAVFSDTYTIQNAGIVQVRTASGWHEGQVHVRTASGWHEAETVQSRTASGWKEST